ncbi:MAG TPA: pyridoxal phosphate-dependent aminotransferase [Candidatus Merdicola faecigallinarum]|uniref:Aminotransferase n=1 Tax=Candidatus Merdicola faecigallinarum TaxID=2840862 RepID=A0A9D1M1I1_9FIRM|nr:pyridoxal phosphate-dependent aminotransferase [Candidatus Merdicola faecigallinarum]
MISDKMKDLVKNNSVIREMFEEGKKLQKLYGKENVFDFSLGNPSVPAPKKVKEAIIKILENEDPCFLHGYMSNSGFEDVREKIAESINRKFGTNFSAKNLIMTVGAASGLNIVLKSIINPGDEVINFAPYFSEYNNYIKNYDGIVTVVSANLETFEPNLEEFKNKINSKTKAVIINTPNNPTGVIYSEELIKKLVKILEEKSSQIGHPIYLISDEPYRELVYDGAIVPYVTKYYKNTFVVYSYSKSLSLPGERIGYVIVPDELDDSNEMIEAITIANRIIGCVNAPSLIQRVIPYCLDIQIDLKEYDTNRKLLYKILTECGFECIKPQGAFYLFVKSPIPDEKEFCKTAKKYHLLFVPCSSFACPGYVRIAYCVPHTMIQRSEDAFRKLAKEYFY